MPRLFLFLLVASLLSPSSGSVLAQPAGGGDRLVLRSKILDEPRTLYVRLPSTYRFTRRHFPVLYVLDGEWHFPVAAAAVQYMSECAALEAEIPELIVVGITNVDRDHDYTPTHVAEYKGMEFPTSGGAPSYRRFLTEEVIPTIDSTYRTTSQRFLAGWSFGGLFTINTLAVSPAAFSGYLAISPSVWWEEERFVASFPQEALPQPARLVVTIGEEEAGGWTHTATTNLVEKLKRQPVSGLDLIFLELEGAGHNMSVPEAFSRGLRALFSDWLAPQTVVGEGMEAVDRYYEELAPIYGGEVGIPKDILMAVGFEAWEKDQMERARQAFEKACALYPEAPMPHYYLGRLLQKADRLDEARGRYSLALEAELRRDPPEHSNVRLFRKHLTEAGPALQEDSRGVRAPVGDSRD